MSKKKQKERSQTNTSPQYSLFCICEHRCDSEDRDAGWPVVARSFAEAVLLWQEHMIKTGEWDADTDDHGNIVPFDLLSPEYLPYSVTRIPKAVIR